MQLKAISVLFLMSNHHGRRCRQTLHLGLELLTMLGSMSFYPNGFSTVFTGAGASTAGRSFSASSLRTA